MDAAPYLFEDVAICASNVSVDEATKVHTADGQSLMTFLAGVSILLAIEDPSGRLW